MIPLAVILISIYSAPGLKPITQKETYPTMHDCEVGAGITQLIVYFDPDMKVRTTCDGKEIPKRRK